MKKYKSRKDVPDKYKWDLKDFYKDEKELNRAFKLSKEFIEKIGEYKGLIKNPNKMFELLELINETNRILENAYVYTYLVNDQELGVSKSMNNKNKAEKLLMEYSSMLSFFEPELLSFSEEEYNALFDNKSLTNFKFMLDKIYRSKSHILSENEENIITKMEYSSNHFDDISSTMLNSCHNYGTVNIDGEEVTITPTNYRSLLKNENREIRKEIREKFSSILEQYGNISAQLLNSYVSLNETESNIRHFDSAWDQKMFNLNMDNKVYDTLVSVVESNVKSLQNYYKLYKEKINLDKLYQYDLNLEISNNNKKYSIEEAQDICLNAISVLGDDYAQRFKKIFDNHYIDYCTYKGKCSGGYSFSTIDHDSRILLSFNGDLDDISTIIHEGGHNVHHQYVMDNNHLQYRDIPNIVCEVASLTNECLLSSYLSENGKTKEEKLAGINNILDVIISNLFGAVREGKIEQEMYLEYKNNGSITKEFMDNKVIESLKKYYGDTVVLDKYSNVSWMRRSHYYMNFYLYSYSICISVASYVAKHILSGDKDLLDNYIKFLSTGSNKWPKDIFGVLGIDLTDEKIYIEAISYFNDMLKKYKELSKEV